MSDTVTGITIPGEDAPQRQKKHPLLTDFRNFLFHVWKHLRLPVPTPVQYDIAYSLQHGTEREVIEAFRGVGKSYITSAFACWLWLNDPELKIMVVSASKDRADAFSTFTKRLISELPLLAHLKPRKDQRDSNIAFDVGPAGASHSPSCKSVGITGQLTGSRANVIIADDVETPKNALTFTMRERLSELIKEFEAVLSPGGRIIYLGTPQTELSLYNRLPERGYRITIWPAQYPSQKQIEAYGRHLAPWVLEHVQTGRHKPGDPVDPQRFTQVDLMARRASYGSAGYALQFMLDTSLSDADKYPLRLRDLIIMDLNPEMAPAKVAWGATQELLWNDLPNVGLTGDALYRPMYMAPEWTEYTGSVMAIDPAGRGADETSYCVVKILHGRLFVTAMGGFNGGYDETVLEGLAKVAKAQQVNLVLVESNFGDGMFTQLLKPYLRRLHPVTVEEVRHGTQKELRIIDTLEPIMGQHRLVVDRRLIEEDGKMENTGHQCFWQMTRITRERGALAHDDRLDALAMGVAYWVAQMAADTDEAEEEYRRGEMDRLLEGFMESCLGGSGASNQWVET